MTALRKPDYLTGGYKMAYLASRARHLTGDEFKALFLMADHLGVKGCFPSQETLAEEAGYSQTKLRRMRNKLAEKGEIGFVAGGGRNVTYYSIPGLPAHTAELRAKKAPSVPKPPPEGATQGGTERSNPSVKRKEDRPDLRVVRNDGWEALVVRASDKMQRYWLPHVELLSEGPDGIRLRTAKSLYADRIKRELEGDGELHAIAMSLGIDPDKVTIDAPGHGPAPALPDTVPLTPRGLDDMAQRIEDKPDKPEPPVLTGNAVSLEAYRTRLSDGAREHEEDDGVPVGDAEVARPRRDGERQERQRLDSDLGSRPGGAGEEDPGDRDGV